MIRLRRYYTALNRYRTGKGFGIHSPFAFRFVLLVLKERAAYYAYDTIRSKRQEAIKGMRGMLHTRIISNKNARIIFRVTNHFNPSRILQFGTNYGVSAVCALCVSSRSEMWLHERKIDEYSITRKIIAEYAGRIRIHTDASACIAEYAASAERPFIIANQVCTEDFSTVAEYLNTVVRGEGVIVARNIGKSENMERLWEQLKETAQTGMSFTNGKIGVFVCSPKLPRQHFPLWF